MRPLERPGRVEAAAVLLASVAEEAAPLEDAPQVTVQRGQRRRAHLDLLELIGGLVQHGKLEVHAAERYGHRQVARTARRRPLVERDHPPRPTLGAMHLLHAVQQRQRARRGLETSFPRAESLSVVARVTTGPGIGLNATRICFTKTFSGPLARPDDVRITSLDGSAIDGLSATVTYDPGTSFDWLRPRLTATSAPARLWLESFPGLMLPGTYHATVQVSSTTPGVAPVSISVTLEIRPNESSTLSVSLATVGLGGAGNGRLTATGIDCVLTNGVQGGDCEESYAPGTVVHVTALPAAGQVFYARCPLLATCTPAGFDLSMHAQEVRFEGGFGAPPSTINVIPRWAGPEYGASTFIEGSHGLRCVNGEESCSAMLDGGVGDFPIVAFAEFGGRFLRWEGACTGDIGSCTVHFDTPGTTKEVIAVFRSAPSSVVLSLQGDGASGSVTVSPALTGEGGNPFACELVEGVAQPGCQGIFEPGGGTVTLTASPAPGSRFAGWDIWLNDDYGPQLRCADPLSATCVLTFAHGNGRIDGYVNFAPQ